jgi:rod shape-determining protein MreD
MSMAEAQPRTRLLMGRLTYVGLATLIVFVQLLPLQTEPASWPAPDLLLLVTLVWVARRPGFAPLWLIAPVFLLSDLLFQRPPGLWAALVVMLTEMLRARSVDLRNMPIGLEWGSVSVGIIFLAVANRFVLAAAMTTQAPLAMTTIQIGMTVLIYPLVVAAAHFIFGVSRPAPGQVDSLGHRL